MAVRRPVTTPVAVAAVAKELSLDISADAVVTGITHDSRDVVAGDLYVAIPGLKNHGIEFISQAISNGAVAVASDSLGVKVAAQNGLPTIELKNPRSDMALLAAAIYGHPEKALTLVGITGTNGKTTVACMVRDILKASGKKIGMIGTLGAFAESEHLPGLRTTPESTDLYATLAYLHQKGITHVVMEVSSHGLALDRVAGLHFASAIFTNLSQDHLDFHANMEDYFAAKVKLFSMTSSAVINIDDEYGQKLISLIPNEVEVITCGQGAQLQSSAINTSSDGYSNCDVKFAGETAHLALPMVGNFNVMNALCAIGSANQVGIEFNDSVKALNNFSGVPGRCERVSPSGDALAIVDYAHTPDAVEKILTQLQQATSGKLICVLGCGGDRDPSKRYDMGRIAAEISDLVVVTDDNPRTEDPQKIRTEVLRGAKTGKAQVIELGDRKAAIAHALNIGAPGDIVAVLGKGHESGQEINGEIFAFDDREVIRQVSANA